MKALLPPTTAAEPEFLLAVQRALRAGSEKMGQDRMAILVHLSRLREARAALPPAHQLHVARSILQEAAQRFDGQVFGLRNGDLALLCRAQLPRLAGQAPEPQASIEPAALPGILARLFHADMARLISVWPLATEGDALLAYAADRLAETPLAPAPTPVTPFRTPPAAPPARPSAADEPGSLAVIDGIAALLNGSRVAELMHRRGAIRLRQADLATGITGHAQRIAFRELSFSVAALEARVASLGGLGTARADPFLFRYLAGRLDLRMLGLLLLEAGSGRPFDLSQPAPDGAPWHINLTLPAILSEAFQRLLDIRQGGTVQGGHSPGRLGIEINCAEAVADPTGFARARDVLTQAGATLVLGGFDAIGLRMTRPWRLGADLLKLDWSRELVGDEGEDFSDDIATVLERIGADTVILHGVETPEAFAWGLARGIELFQGKLIDTMLAERRMAVCERAAGCTQRQCIDRGAAVGSAGRAGCANPRLLDGMVSAGATGPLVAGLAAVS